MKPKLSLKQNLKVFLSDPTSPACNLMLANKTRTSAIGNVALGLIAFLLISRSEAVAALPAALGVLFFIALRLVLANLYHTHRYSSELAWRGWYAFATLACGLCWSAILYIVLADHARIDHVTVSLVLLMGGMAVAGTASLSPDRLLSRAFVTTMLFPTTLTLIANYSTEAHALGAIIMTSLVFLIAQIEAQAKAIRGFQDREERYQALTIATKEVILIHQDGVIVEVNNAVEAVLGWQPREMLGTSVLSLTLEEDRARNLAILGKIHDETLIVRLKRKDGSTFHAEIYGRFFEYKGERAKITCVRNIEDRLAAEQAIHDSTKQIEAVSIEREQAAIETARLKSEFLANMSHEIRTPLNAIVGITDLLGDLATTAQMKKYLRTLSDSSESLLLLVNDILDFSKIDADKMEMEKIQFNIGGVIESQADLLATRAQQKGLMIVAGIDPDLPSLVRGDSGRIGQVLLNLIGNAIKFTEKGHISVRANLQSVEGDKVFVKFEVQDTGMGLSDASREKLFKPFSQADSSTSRKHGGTGLGLSICKKIVEKMGGEIGLESTLGVGSIFWFTLPLEVAHAMTIASQFARGDWTSRQVFVVSDENSSARAIAAYLQAWGLSATIGNSSWIERASKNPHQLYDAVVIPSSVLRRNGLKYKGPVIELQNEEALAGVNGGTFASIGVPVRQSDLYDAVSAALGSQPDSSTNVVGQIANASMERAKDNVATLPTQISAHVLVAEDNSTNQMLVLAQLRKLGITAQAVTNGAEAVAALKNGNFDLVLMDCQMPEVDGFEATRRIREMEKLSGLHIPIIALTANAFEEDKKRCLDVGMDAYLSKPLRREQLVQLLKHYLVAAA